MTFNPETGTTGSHSEQERTDIFLFLDALGKVTDRFGKYRLLRGSGGHLMLLKSIYTGNGLSESDRSAIQADQDTLREDVKALGKFLQKQVDVSDIPSSESPERFSEFLTGLHGSAGCPDLSIGRLKEVLDIASEGGFRDDDTITV